MQQERHHVWYCKPDQNPTTWEVIGPRMELTIAILLNDNVVKLPLNMFIPTDLSCSQAWPEKCLLATNSNNSMQIHNQCVEEKVSVTSSVSTALLHANLRDHHSREGDTQSHSGCNYTHRPAQKQANQNSRMGREDLTKLHPYPRSHCHSMSAEKEESFLFVDMAMNDGCTHVHARMNSTNLA